MSEKDSREPSGYIIFDHDGTLVNTDVSPFILFNGMKELLQELKTQNFELYMWTSRGRKSALDSLKRLEVVQYFNEAYCYDDGIPKPHPMGLEELTRGLPKDKILHIGDSYTDFEGAHAYGIEVIAACWNDPNTVQKYAEYADFTAVNLDQCREIIKRKFHV